MAFQCLDVPALLQLVAVLSVLGTYRLSAGSREKESAGQPLLDPDVEIQRAGLAGPVLPRYLGR